MQDHPAPCNTVQREWKVEEWLVANYGFLPLWGSRRPDDVTHPTIRGSKVEQYTDREIQRLHSFKLRIVHQTNHSILSGRCPDGKSSGVLVQMIILSKTSGVTVTWSVYWDCDSEKWRWQTQWSPILGDRRLVMGGWGIKWCRSVFRHLIIMGETSCQLDFLHFWKMFVNPVSTFKAISWSGCKVPHWG